MSNDPSSLRRDIEDSLKIESTPKEIFPNTATVKINIAPSAIPIYILPYSNILANVYEQFHSSFDMSSVKLPPGQDIPDQARVMEFLISQGSLVNFRGGYVRSGDDQDSIITIERLGFGSQTIVAEVSGTTKQAEYICKKLGELLWQSVGRERRWSEISDQVNIVSYSTSTMVQIGSDPRGIFSTQFRNFLTEDIEAPKQLGSKMGHMGQQPFVSQEDFRVVTSFRSISLEVAIFDEVSGKQEECVIEIIPHSTFDHNRPRLKIQSELPYELHIEMITRLIKRLKSTA